MEPGTSSYCNVGVYQLASEGHCANGLDSSTSAHWEVLESLQGKAQREEGKSLKAGPEGDCGILGFVCFVFCFPSFVAHEVSGFPSVHPLPWCAALSESQSHGD